MMVQSLLGTASLVVICLGLAELAAKLLCQPVRHQIKRWLKRQLFFSHYDYRREWTLCTQRMASVMEVEELCVVASRAVSDTFGVPSVTLWLLDEEREDQLILGGSTVFWGIRGLPDRWEETSSAIRKVVSQSPLPVDFSRTVRPGLSINKSDLPDKSALSGLQHEALRAARIRYGVGLIVRQQLLGVITLGERLIQKPFTTEDHELLKTMADQIAASLLNLQLSRRLLRAKEIEAFQTVSAFFIHDLKNLAAKLSLMVQNLPVHYDNPAFRDDMLQVISKSVSKMNGMCSRLDLLTTTVELCSTEFALHELVQDTLNEWDGMWPVAVHRDIQAIPRVWGDPEEIAKVLRNLLLNAAEASGEDGEIEVEIAQTDRWVVLIVRDHGCGMSDEFQERSLFAPFQTTKSQGLGIGMFHTKMIVEAHHGRIEVDSTQGQGTTFRILLPLAARQSVSTSLATEPEAISRMTAVL